MAKKMLDKPTSKRKTLTEQVVKDGDKTLPPEWEEGGGGSRGWPGEKKKVRRDSRGVLHWRDDPRSEQSIVQTLESRGPIFQALRNVDNTIQLVPG